MAERVLATGDQTTLADRKRRAGQRLIIGLSGPSVDDDLRALVQEIQPAGFVLFGRNIEEPEQVLELNRELASLVAPSSPAILAVDQEGGRVQRVRDPATVWPPMRDVGRAAMHTHEVSSAMALELRAMGFNLNFAPVSDVDSNPANPVIADRSFGRTPELVSEQVVAFIRAHQAAGMVACAKHFPGHGDTEVDSHLALPVVEREEPDLRHVELAPFAAAVRAGVGSVMSSHVVYPAWDEEWPATLSARIIPRLLRDELNYAGVVFSDDMEMKAIHGRWETMTQVTRSTHAGIDVLLSCEQPGLQYDFFHSLVLAQERDQGQHNATVDAVERVDTLRRRFFLNASPRPPLSVVGDLNHKILAAMVRDRGAA